MVRRPRRTHRKQPPGRIGRHLGTLASTGPWGDRTLRPAASEPGIPRCRYSRLLFHETLGTLSLGVSQHAGDIGTIFFCLGTLPWYYVLFQSRIVPRLLSLCGLLAVPLATLLLVWDRGSEPSIAVYTP